MSRFAKQVTKKRILSDNTLAYNNQPLPVKKQKTLEFQSVTIKPTSLPRPNNKQEINRDPSNIPVAPTISPSKSLKDIKQILSMQNRLKEPLRISAPKLEPVVSKQKEVETISLDLINDLTEEYYRSNSEYLDLTRSYKKYINKIDEASSRLKTLRWKYQSEEDLIMQNVTKEENLVNEEIDRYQKQLKKAYFDLEAQLINELDHCKSFSDKLILQEILKFQEKSELLLEKLESLEIENDQKILNSKIEFEKNLTIALQPKIDQINSLTSKFEDEKKRNISLVQELSRLNEDISSSQSKKEHLQKSIKQLDFNFENFENSKTQILSDLQTIEKEIESILSLKKTCDLEFEVEHQKYMNTQNELKNYNLHRQILENSIMDYENRIRVYMIGMDSLDNHGFNKILAPDQKNIPDEFSALIKSSLKGNNIVISFYGKKSITTESIIKSCEYLRASTSANDSLDLTFLSLQISNSTIFDTLDNQKEVLFDEFHQDIAQISSQKMIIDEEATNQIENTLNQEKSTDEDLHVHIINIERNKIKSSIIFIDFCKKPVKKQISELELFVELCTMKSKPITFQDKLLLFAFNKSKYLILANIEDIEHIERLELINCLTVVNRIKLPNGKA